MAEERKTRAYEYDTTGRLDLSYLLKIKFRECETKNEPHTPYFEVIYFQTTPLCYD